MYIIFYCMYYTAFNALFSKSVILVDCIVLSCIFFLESQSEGRIINVNKINNTDTEGLNGLLAFL